MKTYLTNIKAAWKTYKDGRWPKRSISVYYFMFKYTIKYLKSKLNITN